MKKLLTVIISILLLLSLAACIVDDTNPEPTETSIVEEKIIKPSGIEAAANSYFTSSAESKIVEWDEVLALIDDESPFILSIRQKEAYNQGHVQGAYNAEWGSDLAGKLEMLPTNKTVYIYCDNGQTSSQAAALLGMLGIDALSINLGYTDGFLKTNDFEEYISKRKLELPKANSGFDTDILTFAVNYLLSIEDIGNHMLPANQVNMMAEWDTVALVDLRSEEDFNKGHIDNAVNIPFDENIIDNIKELNNGNIILIDYSGQISGQITVILRALEYDAFTLKYGMNLGWVPYITINAAADFFKDYTSSFVVSWKSITQMLDDEEEIFILSLQDKREYEAGHVAGAYSAPWGKVLSDTIPMLPTGQKIYIYSNDGQTSYQTAILLHFLGIEAYAINKGFDRFTETQGYEKYIELDSNSLSDAKSEFNPFILMSVQDYFANAPEFDNYSIPAEALEKSLKNNQFVIIDLRDNKDYNVGHIENTVNIPFGEDMHEFLVKYHSNKIVLVDSSGQLSHQLTAILRQLGYDAISLDAGMNAWIEDELPVTKD